MKQTPVPAPAPSSTSTEPGHRGVREGFNPYEHKPDTAAELVRTFRTLIAIDSPTSGLNRAQRRHARKRLVNHMGGREAVAKLKGKSAPRNKAAPAVDLK